ncbi:MAG: 3-oxoadipate enol-lactonase [Gaiellales bacterium]|nr:3-oxoadipate enol-lactonase [Gaiellales bacterium]
MTLVLLAPIAFGASCWEGVPFPDVPTAKHELPGFGSRARAATQPTMASLAAEVAATYDGSLDLVGVSMGGMVAQHVAIDYPERIRSLLVACTGAVVNPATMLARADAAEAEGMEGVLPVTLERWFTPRALATSPPHPGVEYARRTLLALAPSAFADGWRAMAGHDVRDRLSSITAVTTCVAGASDVVGTPERVRELTAGIKGAQMVSIEGPHMIQLECPAEFGFVVGEHLERVRDA